MLSTYPSIVTQSCTQLLHHHSQIRKRVNWPVNFNGFRLLASLLYQRRSRDVNQTLHDVWLSPGLVRYVYVSRGLLPPNIIFQDAKFTLRPSLAYCTALEQRVSAKLCGVVQGMELRNFLQTVPPILDRAAITLGIGPHSSFYVSFIMSRIYAST